MNIEGMKKAKNAIEDEMNSLKKRNSTILDILHSKENSEAILT
jgi:hypothetical protein